MEKVAKGKNRIIVYVLIALIIIAAIYLLYPKSNSIHVNSSQAQVMLGSPLANYYTSDLFNASVHPVNISYFYQYMPSLKGNVTGGWATEAAGSNNATLTFFVFQTPNPIKISSVVSSFMATTFNGTPEITNSGTINGFNYTYNRYYNTKSNFQVFSGWKSNYAEILIVSSSGFVANKTQVLTIISNDTK